MMKWKPDIGRRMEMMNYQSSKRLGLINRAIARYNNIRAKGNDSNQLIQNMLIEVSTKNLLVTMIRQLKIRIEKSLFTLTAPLDLVLRKSVKGSERFRENGILHIWLTIQKQEGKIRYLFV